MSKNQLQHIVYALITVVITVHAFVFYSLYVVEGDGLMRATGTTSVLQAIDSQGGVYMFGRYLPIWLVIVVEMACALPTRLPSETSGTPTRQSSPRTRPRPSPT